MLRWPGDRAAALLAFERVVKRHVRTALDGLDLAIAEGEGVAVVGPNGAGKTTLLRLAAALDRPTEGRVLVAGHDTRTEDDLARAAVGWCGDRPGLFPELTVDENLAVAADLRRVPRSAARAAATALGLAPVHARRAAHLSRGWAQRAALARALVGDPPILVLDEPFEGLDAEGRSAVEAVLADRRARGRTDVVAAARAPEGAWRVVRLANGRVAEAGA